jgi:transcriptional regulator with XRE-family HTH domain
MTKHQPDPQYVADRTRYLREVLGLKQESLAEAAGLTVRTIQNVESGRHMPDEQTLKAIARATDVDVSYFTKPTPEAEARDKAAMEHAKKHTDIVPIAPVRSVADFLAAFNGNQALRFDLSAVNDDAALKVASAMHDWVDDLMLAWSDFSATDQFEYAKTFLDYCEDLEAHGYVYLAGRHKERLRGAGITAHVGVICLLPREQVNATRYALIQMEGGWEKAE